MPCTSDKDLKNATVHPGLVAKLWLSGVKLRNHVAPAEYKHVAFGLIFLKYISDRLEEHRAKLAAGEGDYTGANPKDPDEYRADNIFWVPPEARWGHLKGKAKLPTIRKDVDDAMSAVERDNPRIKGVLPKDYARQALDKHRLGERSDLIATINLVESNQFPPQPSSTERGRSEVEGEGCQDSGSKEGSASHRSVDLLGRVYEYFLTMFASAEDKNGGQFYTPSCIVRLIVAMLAPYRGRVLEPACGSAGMFVQSEKFVLEHDGRLADISIYGEESNPTTRRLALMNLAIRGIEGDLGPEHADTIRRDLHKDLRAQFFIANPPFNDSEWHRVEDDVRWKDGVSPKGNANFAWVQRFIHHLAPDGYAGFVLANGSMSSNQSGEGDIRQAISEDELVDGLVALPGQIFHDTQVLALRVEKLGIATQYEEN